MRHAVRYWIVSSWVNWLSVCFLSNKIDPPANCYESQTGSEKVAYSLSVCPHILIAVMSLGHVLWDFHVAVWMAINLYLVSGLAWRSLPLTLLMTGGIFGCMKINKKFTGLNRICH